MNHFSHVTISKRSARQAWRHALIIALSRIREPAKAVNIARRAIERTFESIAAGAFAPSSDAEFVLAVERRARHLSSHASGRTPRIRELDCVALAHAVAEHGLEIGDIGAVVHVYAGGAAYEVEFLGESGRTVAVLTLRSDEVRALDSE
jgi:hypothetical protein